MTEVAVATEIESPVQPMQQKELTELQTLIIQAKKGDQTALPRLRKYLDLNPRLWQVLGDIGSRAQLAWVRLMAGRDLHLPEVTLRKINAWKKELAGGNPTPIELLLVERIIMARLQLAYIEMQEAKQPEMNIRWAEFQLKRQSQAEKQLCAAVNDLTNLRKAQAQKTIIVKVEQPVPTSWPTMPDTLGEMSQTYHGSTNRIKNLICG